MRQSVRHVLHTAYPIGSMTSGGVEVFCRPSPLRDPMSIVEPIIGMKVA